VSRPTATPQTEERLSTDTWQEAYAAWRLPLLRYVHRLTRDPHLAEDVTQEAFLRLVREAGPVRNPRAWLFQVCTNLVRDGARRRETEERDAWDDDRPVPMTPDLEAERAETVQGVRQVLDRLSQRDRAALLMREEGFKHAEIAQALGVRTEIIPALLARALKRFRRAYELDAQRGRPSVNDQEERHDAPR
jgi:RNA polymerase sigma factor (sigma-70 family)